MANETAVKHPLAFVPIDFQSMQDKVYDQITQVLMRGGFAPGQKVSSRKLAAVMGTSDMPVRAALGRLLAEGGLVQNSNGTFSVPTIGRRTFREVMELRALLEGRATAGACGKIDADGFLEIQKCSDGLEASILENNIQGYLDFNQRLKFAIYIHSPSTTLVKHIQLLWLQAGPFLRHLNTGLSQMTQANFHQQAVAALKANDAAAASAAIARDVEAGMEFLLAHASFANEPGENIPNGPEGGVRG